MGETIKVGPTDIAVIPQDGGVLMTTIDRVVRKEPSPTGLDQTIEVHDRRKKKDFRRKVVNLLGAISLTASIGVPVFIARESLSGEQSFETPTVSFIEGVVFIAGAAGAIKGRNTLKQYDIEIDRLELQEKKLKAYVVEEERKAKLVRVISPSASG